MSTEKATFAAGCFWGIEAAFRQVPGVIDAISGYTGGHMPNPSYRDVCGDETGHAEAVEVTYDPQRVSYDDLLRMFWQIHDPTTPNRQGPDIGTQYRSAIFVHDADQRERAQASLRAEQQNHSRPIVTEIVDASTFYPAEEYHQRYYEKHGVACHVKL
jgi:peptide-methionine (S)-S-oxide reductase